MRDFSVELINDNKRLDRLIDRISGAREIGLDIETVNWWDQRKEKISIIQIAYKSEPCPKVAVVDVLANFDHTLLREPLELCSIIKVIHNAVFDATRLAKHFQFNVNPIYDTMVAARRNAERRYSLRAQAETHLNLRLDKAGQRSDWSRRPLDPRQLHYAALDALSTLLLYENQIKRNLNGAFRPKTGITSEQALLPLSGVFETPVFEEIQADDNDPQRAENTVYAGKPDLSPASLALLGIVAELPGRYHPDRLAVSVSAERVGLAGWIVDRTLGEEADLDEETAKLEIADLCERVLLKITDTRRLEATDEGRTLWHRLKSI